MCHGSGSFGGTQSQVSRPRGPNQKASATSPTKVHGQYNSLAYGQNYALSDITTFPPFFPQGKCTSCTDRLPIGLDRMRVTRDLDR